MIYICIPTHNEQQTVGVVLWKLRQVLTDFPREYQLLVADDASTDKTPQVLEPYTRVLPLTVIRSERRQGQAASLEMLLREAVRRSEYPKRDIVVTLQADFSEEPDDLVPLVKRIEAGADVAAGNKISGMKEPRARRFARSLASFFMRRQKWPEGVASPFDGYRAYRLYSVKRAMEDRKGRLLRHDGWAGHAELLRAVLPHARRVDAVNVDDRPDRHQRARRERPFAAAMQVRVLGSGVEPPGLVGVEELDRIAATASRSRDRAALTAQSLERGGEARSNGTTRSRQGARRDSGRRSQSNGGRQKAEAGDGRRPEGRASRPKREAGQSPERGGQKGAEPRRRRQPQGEESRARSRPPEDAAAVEEPVTAADPAQATEGSDVAEAQRPKKRRRRRKRGGQRSGSASAPSASGDEQPSAESASDDAPAARSGGDEPASGSAPSEGAPTGEKKRRRRGGRRGGRGRRRPKRDGAEGGDTSDGSDAGTETGAAEPVARVEND